MPAVPSYLIDVTRLGGVSFYSLSLASGLLTTIAAAGQLCAFRYVSAGAGAELLFHVTHLRSQWLTSAGFTAAQEMAIAAYKVNTFTTPPGGSGQVPLALAPTYPASQLLGYIASTTALTSAVFTLDRQIFRGGYAELAAGASVQKGFIDEQAPMLDDPHPVCVLGNQDGIVVRNEVLMGAGGVGRLVVDIRGYERAA